MRKSNIWFNIQFDKQKIVETLAGIWKHSSNGISKFRLDHNRSYKQLNSNFTVNSTESMTRFSQN